MAITLAEAKVGMADKVDQMIVDEFRRSSLLLDRLVFDNAISPGTGGSTLTYGYIQLNTPSTAAVRAINSEYTANEAKRVEKTAKAIIMGGSFSVDRVLQNTSGAVDELAFQAQQKIKATSNYFHNLVINGTSAAAGAGYVPGTFDGLKKLLSGTSTELSSGINLSTSALLDSNANAFIDQLDQLVHTIDGDTTMLMMNSDMLMKVRSCARRAGYYERTKNDFGQVVETFAGIPLMDMGKYYNGTSSVDVIGTSAATAAADGTTSIYAVSIGLDGFHGISPTGNSVISSYSGYCSVEMWASGGERTDVTTMYSGYIDASEPFIRTYHYGFGSGAVVAKNGTNNTSTSGAAGVAATVSGANATVRGCGGSGGNGGSGGGAGGWYQDSNTGSTRNYSGGVGGAGSAGGNGADGIILIYYGKEVE